MKTIKKSQHQSHWYQRLGLVAKLIWMDPDTIYKLEVYAARLSKDKHERISFMSVVNEILNAKARELPNH